MIKKDKKEVLIIGAGPGGYGAAFRAADLGLKVTLIDPEINPGGVCLYKGCIPSKALLHVSKTKQETAKAAQHGLKFQDPEIDVKKIFAWKNKVVEKLTNGLGQLSKARKIEYIRGKARFISKDQVEVEQKDGENYTIHFENAIIATGSMIMQLPNITIDHKLIIDSSDALDLKEIPENMLIIGGGYIGLELGTFYASMGCNVSIAEMTPDFLPGTDKDLVKIFKDENEDLFTEVHFKTKVEKASAEENKVKVTLAKKEGKEEKEFDKVLVAVGRKPYSESLNLKEAGIKTDDKGFVKVNAKRQTNIENIYAIGDIAGQPFLAHKATHEGRIAAEVIAGEAGAGYDPRAIPAIVFTNPEIAWCGLTESDAKEQDKDVKVVKYPWTASGRAACIGTEHGITKLIFDPETGVLLGGAVAGKNAGAMIPEIALAIEMGATAGEIADCIHPHPTLSEMIMEASEMFYGAATHIISEKKTSKETEEIKSEAR